MEIIFREQPHTYDEVAMGHKLWFRDSIESDAISATANIGGFTPLTAIARRYEWNRDMITAASNECNERKEIAIVRNLNPTLLLVPATQGKGDTSFLITDLINAANTIGSDVLNFTHYGFVQNKLPEAEINLILDMILDPYLKSSIRVVVWDIDFRFKTDMIKIWKLKRAYRANK